MISESGSFCGVSRRRDESRVYIYFRWALRCADLDALDRLLRELRGSARRALIIVEGAYSMDGECLRKITRQFRH